MDGLIHSQSEWTDDDRDIRNFFGLIASVGWGAVIMTLLTVPNYNHLLLGTVALVSSILTIGFLAWRRIKTHVGQQAYHRLASLASDMRLYVGTALLLIVWLIASGLVDDIDPYQPKRPRPARHFNRRRSRLLPLKLMQQI